MTLLPLENRDVQGLEGTAYPKYTCGPVCSAPSCSRFADHSHHLFRRSFLAGDYAWVKLPDGTIVGNLTGLCWRCHEDITQNRTWIQWRASTKQFVYADNKGNIYGALFPQPPQHGEPQPQPAEEIIGPAGKELCPSCKRPLPHTHDKEAKKEPARRRKTWTVTVPDDGEDGALVLDTLMDECRKLFSHDEAQTVRYITLVQALALVVQNGHDFISEGQKSGT